MATPRASAPTDPAGSVPPRRRTARRGRLLWLGLGLIGVAGAAIIHGLAPRMVLATAYGARIGCACHFEEGRPLGACRQDFEPGMGPVVLSADAASRSVTARIPLLAAQTATYRDGPGCQLESWHD